MNYKKFYKVYRKLPVISTIILALSFFAWSILDVFGIPYQFGYGMFEQTYAILALIIWWVIGLVNCLLTYVITAIAISATVLRTDATIEINEKLNDKNQ